MAVTGTFRSDVRFWIYLLISGGTIKTAIAFLLLGKGLRMSDCTAKRPVVLIVEDDFLIRMHAADMIAADGFGVVEAASADQAIVILEDRLDITVVFTDVQMPGSMDGLKLAAAIRRRWPPIKIVATSGFVDVRQSDLPEGGRFLPKPYSPEQIVRTLRELTSKAA
jgi:CheY-like chemotaxis protein